LCLEGFKLKLKFIRENQMKKGKIVNCAICGKEVYRSRGKIEKCKSGLFFVVENIKLKR